jgi:hypothetical protein
VNSAQFFKSEKGASTVFFALAIVVVLGCASLGIDLGLLVNERARLSNAVDSAALAGAQELVYNRGNAESVVNSYLAKNDAAPSSVKVVISEDGKNISVTAKKNVNYLLAPILGIDNDEISVNAVAKWGPLKAVTSGIRPLAIENQPLEFGNVYVLKEAAGDGTSGNYGALALGGSGSINFETKIINGYKGKLEKNQSVNTETGNMSGATRDGIAALLASCPHFPKCTFDSFQPDCPKIITVVMIDSLSDLSGKSQVQITGFASFFLESVEFMGGHTEILGRFVKTVDRGEMSEDQPDTGVYGVKLIK